MVKIQHIRYGNGNVILLRVTGMRFLRIQRDRNIGIRFYHDKIPTFTPKIYMQGGYIRGFRNKCQNYRFTGTYQWYDRH